MSGTGAGFNGLLGLYLISAPFLFAVPTWVVWNGVILEEKGAVFVHELVVAMGLDGTATDIADAIHIHPMLPEVADSAAGSVHKPSRTSAAIEE